MIAALVVLAAACAQKNEPASGTQTESTSTTGSTGTAPASATTRTAAAPAAENKETNAMTDTEPKVAELHTSAGQIDIRFFPDVAPNHVNNFLTLAEKGFYNGTKFHRVIPGFMIQGGDPNTIKGDPYTWGTGGSPTRLKAEFNKISHKRGIVSMARSQDPNSASSQFFIVTSDSTFLDNQYTVFGQVLKGMDVADKIVNGKAANERPVAPVSIDSITIRPATAEEIAKPR
jgi:cyclophilin family peptidyl-prolyl cis-trans isomerase